MATRPSLGASLRAVSIAMFLLAATVGPSVGQSTGPAVGDGGVSPFYTWTDSIEHTMPGTMLRTEPLEQKLVLSEAGSATRILYVSTDGIDGRTPVIVSGSVFFPNGTMPPGGWPIVAWAHGTTGVADVCAPSTRGWSSRDKKYLNTWLTSGYAVVATDYQGLGVPGPHPYLLVRPEAYSVLDALRASLAQWPTQLDNKVILVGQSQGSGAALAAGYYWPSYAPSVGVLGVIGTGIVGIVIHGSMTEDEEIHPPTVESDKYPPAAYEIMVLEGSWKSLNPALDDHQYVADDALPLTQTALSKCLIDTFRQAAALGIKAATVFKANTDPLATEAVPYGEIPDAKFVLPIFTGTGLADNEVLPSDQYRFLRAACNGGANVAFHYYPGLTHNGTVNGSLVDSLPFAKSLVSGVKPTSNCSQLNDPGPLQPPTPGIDGNN